MTFFTASEMLQRSMFFDVFNNHKYIMCLDNCIIR